MLAPVKFLIELEESLSIAKCSESFLSNTEIALTLD